ncbi:MULTISPECIES: hypothetical protein [unclassified Streptomyces]|uniref:VMAP-C domain-containing protein n=1 Tax=unclassified Streptomyces TaxID=2593676 RepID=UPI002365F4E7|nr:MULTISPECIES: hypothetical protein [unclassified Streptomyces]MDF3146824.1 hypothetical protein [Streptomyces sp. T21Q-yed]WDF38694.1 hypothetical protein PBV52_18790 [Streptomyces sp. T12]
MFRHLRRRLSVGRTAPQGTGPTPPRPERETERDTEQLLVGILAAIPRLRSVDGRKDLLQQADPRLGDAAPEHNVTRDHLHAIVATARRTGTLQSLRDALACVEPDDIATEWFDLAVVVLTGPPGPLPAPFMLEIIGELHRHKADFGRTAVHQYRTERRTAGRPLDADRLPQVLAKLYDARVTPAEPDAPRTQLLRFLALLAAEPAIGPQLARLVASVQGRGAGAGTPPASGDRQIIIQIRVEEEDAPSDLPYTQRRYSLRGYHYERVGDGRPAFRGSQSLPGTFAGGELKDCGRGFLAAWQEPAEAGRGVNKRVEFLLPHSLLDHPAESWPGGSAGVPLSRSCQVVVRSLTRYKDSTIHDEWIRRWQALEAADRDGTPGDALERIGWMGPDTPERADGQNPTAKPWSCPGSSYSSLRLSDPADVADWLLEHADLSCLGLGIPYDHRDELIREAVRGALLEDGIPVMVWRRDDGDPGSLLDVLRHCRPLDRLADLPHSVHEARKRGRRDPESVHNRITLLWDDPTCVFSGQDQPMTGTRGAGEGAA